MKDADALALFVMRTIGERQVPTDEARWAYEGATGLRGKAANTAFGLLLHRLVDEEYVGWRGPQQEEGKPLVMVELWLTAKGTEKLKAIGGDPPPTAGNPPRSVSGAPLP